MMFELVTINGATTVTRSFIDNSMSRSAAVLPKLAISLIEYRLKYSDY